MKVLHIINSLHTGGAEKLLVDSLPLYQECGVTVDLLLLDADNPPFLEQLKKDFTGRIFHTNINSYYSPLQILSIKKYLKKDYDVIHCHLFPVLYWTAIAKALFAPNTKIIFTEHSTENRRLNNRVFLTIDKVIYKFYNKITAITPEVKQSLVNKLDLPSNKIEVIYNGINIKKFTNSVGYNKTDFFSNDDKILIQVSRFQAQKDQQTVIRCLVHLPPYYKLLLVGDGELKANCQQLVDELGLQARVKFLGMRMDVPDLLKTADIVVQSSHCEGFGLAAVEGMAVGKPVIVSDVKGLGDIVRNYGLTFKVGSAKDLAEKILLLEDTEYCQQVVYKCKERAKEFNILNMVKNNLKLYKFLVK